MMVAKRRRKLQVLAGKLPPPEMYGAPEGNVLLIGWGSTKGPIHEAVDAGARRRRKRQRGSPALPDAAATRSSSEIMDGFNHVFVVELNDEGLYGYGQLAGILRARFCDRENSRDQQDRWPAVQGPRNPER